MKHILTIFGLLYACIVFGQTNFNDLTESTNTASTDQFTIVNGAGTVTTRMSYETLLTEVFDSIGQHRLELHAIMDSLEDIRFDVNLTPEPDPPDPPDPWDGDVWYVSTTGSDSNDGDTITEPFATISHAISGSSRVAAGDSIYVKAGNYGNVHNVMSISGTAEDRIVIQGYKTTPGDQPKDDWTYGDSHITTETPYYQHDNRSNGYGFDFNEQEYITINNMQVKYYRNPVYIDGGHNIIENFFCTESGDVSGSKSYMDSGIYLHGNKQQYWPNSSATGYDADSCKVINCTVINGTGAGIWTWSDYDTIVDCEVWCDDNSTGDVSSMDYYIVTTGRNTHIEDCYVERVGDLDHGGHGIGVKGAYFKPEFTGGDVSATIVGCTARNIEGECFWVAKQDVRHVTFTDCIAKGGGYHFTVRDGPSHTLYDNCWSDSSGLTAPNTSAIDFLDGFEWPHPASTSSDSTTFKNCLFTNGDVAIGYRDYDYATAAVGNKYVNCTFDNFDYFMRMELPNSTDSMINCIVSNIPTRYYDSATETDNIHYTYTNWYTTFTAPTTGTGHITTDPEYVDPSTFDFTLESTSNAIDSGREVEGIEYLGTAPDMGAFEKE